MPVDEGFRGGDQVNVPNPDPSLLTTQNLRDGLAALKELITVRLDAMDVATQLRLESFGRVPADIQAQIMHLREVQDEKFHTINNQFVERDVRTAQASVAADDALKAAVAGADICGRLERAAA